MTLVLLVLIGLGGQLGVLHGTLALAPSHGSHLLRSVPPDAALRCFGASAGQALAEGSTSIIAVSANRTASLLSVLPSWLVVRGVSEILLVDWGHPERQWLDEELRSVSADPRLRVVRVPEEEEWHLARAYNLAAQLARGERVLKVDSDTWLAPEALERQVLAPRTFLRGCRDRALDENGRHLNGVLLIRRTDFLAVYGYDERMRGYGYDDTDLYARLGSSRNLSEVCLSFALMSHAVDGHAERGLTHINHILHRRATKVLYKPWHDSGLVPSTWEVRSGHSSGGVASCMMVSGSRPPFFDELLRGSDEMVLAHQEALQLYAQRTLKATAVTAMVDLGDLRTLMSVYRNLLSTKQPYLAVRPMHGLANRLRAYCSASAYAQQTGRRLLVVWEPDVHTQTTFGDLFEQPAGVDVIRAARAGLFPAELWKWYNHMVPDRARRRNVVSADADGRALYVTSAYRLETEPPLDKALYYSCLRELRPVEEVRSLLIPRGGEEGLGRRIGVHVRMMVDQTADVPGIEADSRPESNLGMMNEARPYREACHYSAFVQAMRARRELEASASFYLAADSAEAYQVRRPRVPPPPLSPRRVLWTAPPAPSSSLASWEPRRPPPSPCVPNRPRARGGRCGRPSPTRSRAGPSLDCPATPTVAAAMPPTPAGGGPPASAPR